MELLTRQWCVCVGGRGGRGVCVWDLLLHKYFFTTFSCATIPILDTPNYPPRRWAQRCIAPCHKAKRFCISMRHKGYYCPTRFLCIAFSFDPHSLRFCLLVSFTYTYPQLPHTGLKLVARKKVEVQGDVDIFKKCLLNWITRITILVLMEC